MPTRQIEKTLKGILHSHDFALVTNKAVCTYAFLKTHEPKGCLSAYFKSYEEETGIYRHLVIVRSSRDSPTRMVYFTSSYDELWVDQGLPFQLCIVTKDVVKIFSDPNKGVLNSGLIYDVQPKSNKHPTLRWLKVQMVLILRSLGVIKK